MDRAKLVLAGIVAVLLAASPLHGATCGPPPGFHDGPHPEIAPAEQMAAHTESILIARPLATVQRAMDAPLNQTIRAGSALPGVAGDYLLTPGPFGAPGSRRIVCLTDGTSVEEESLERDGTATRGHYRYIVWNYTTPKARPIAYGIGEFRSARVDAHHTRVTWIYSFRLRDNRFPGELGAVGRWLFEVGFLDRDYATMMQGVLAGYKASAESAPN
ncbi:MAG TPA: hypothetical protein VMD92_08020 [Acidobacteriaceae bacterium]|nr:hypothetical protein [Acidobacteriaceae bacterium]